MFAVKLLAHLAVASNCYIRFWTCHFTDHLRYYYYKQSLLKAVKPFKVAHLQKLANQSMLNGVLVIELVTSFFSESK